MLRATFLFLLLLLFPWSVFAATNRHSAADGAIQTAFDAAKPGNVILLEPGHYKERLVLRPGIILRGTARDAVIIDGQGSAPVVTLQQDSQLLTLQVTGGGAFHQAVYDRHHASRGEQLAGEAGAAGLVSAAVEVSATALVRGCSVHDNGGPGIAVSGTNNQSVIENNTRSEPYYGPLPPYKYSLSFGVDCVLNLRGKPIHSIQADPVYEHHGARPEFRQIHL